MYTPFFMVRHPKNPGSWTTKISKQQLTSSKHSLSIFPWLHSSKMPTNLVDRWRNATDYLIFLESY